MIPVAALGVAVLLPLVVLLSTVLLLGWQLQVIETASMEPRVPAGSLAVVEPIDAADVRSGMVIVFEDPAGRGRLVAHRAVTRLPSDGAPAWQSKGDANAEADLYPVHAPAIRGRVRWTIPRLGALVSALDGPITVLVLVGAPLMLLAATEIRALRRKRSNRAAPANGSVIHADRHAMRVYAIRDLSSSGEHPLGQFVDVFVRREDAERFIHDMRRDEPALADHLRIVERTLDAGARN